MTFFHNRGSEGGNSAPPVNFGTRPGSEYQQQQQPFSSDSQSQYAPRIFNLNNNDVVHTRLYTLEGSAGQIVSGVESSVIVYHHINSFPSLRYQVTDGYFKALVHLNPGVNKLRLVWEDTHNPNSNIYTDFTVNYVPLLQNPPLHYALIVAKDSPLEFDSPSYKRDKEGNSLELAIKKVRLASYMMAAYTNEQMRRAGYGQRTFRIHEEYQKDTLSDRDQSLRSTTKVHIIRSDRTTAEIRDPNRAQQNEQGSDRGGLFGIALDAIRSSGIKELEDNGEQVMVTALFLDGHWDADNKLITGHAALGGGSGHIRLAIFGSHALWSFPTSLEEITSCMLDTTRIDTCQVAKDCDNEGTAWEVFNVGFGAWLHEIGHLLGCPHEPYGIMLRDWWMNRAFMSREGYSAGTRSEGKRPLRPEDDSVWHPLDLIRFRFHPAFRSPFENRVQPAKFALYPLENGVFASSMTGIFMVEIYSDNDLAGNMIYREPCTELFLFEDDVMQQIKESRFRDPSRTISLWLHSVGGEEYQIKDYRELERSGRIENNLGHAAGIVSTFVGGCGGEEKTVFFPKYLGGVNIRSGSWIDAIEFIPAPGGPTERPSAGGSGGGNNEFYLDRDEYVTGFYLRAGAWLDGIQVITNKRRGPYVGNTTGGSPAELIAPQGYQVVGIKTHVSDKLTSFALIYVPRN